MKNFFLAALTAVALALALPLAPAQAQFGSSVVARGTISVNDGSVAITTLTDIPSFGVSVVNSGTYTLQFEGSVDGGRNFVAVYGTVNDGSGDSESSTAAPGTWFFTNTGLSNFRVRASAYTSGAPVVTVTRGYAKGGSSGSGGAAVTVLPYSDGPANILYRSNRFYALGQDTASSFNQGNLTNNNGYLGPFRPATTVTFNQLGVQVVTGNASTAVNIVVYASDATGGWPGTLLYSSGSVATTSSSTYSFASSSLPTFTAGTLYWVGVLASGTSPNVRLWATSTGVHSGLETGIQNGGEHLIQQSGLTFASPPNPWGFAESQLVSGNPPVMVGRAP